MKGKIGSISPGFILLMPETEWHCAIVKKEKTRNLAMV